MVFLNALAQKALLQFLYNHWAQASVLEWNAPLDDLTYLSLPEPKREVQLFPFLSGRVVDVVKVLEAAKYAPEIKEKITLEIADDLAEWNNGVFALEVSGGKGNVQPWPQSGGEVQCTIGALSQLVFGRISARELAKVGRLATNFPGNIEILETLFPKCNNYINEYY
jgi:predicted acetyltransferase